MDIGQGEANSPGGHKYVLVLVDTYTSNTFVYGIHGTSGADVVEARWNFSLTPVDSLALSNAILTLDLLVGRLFRLFDLTDVMYVLHYHIDKIDWERESVEFCDSRTGWE